MKKSTRRTIITFAVTGLLLGGSYIGLQKYCDYMTNKPHSYTLSSNILDEEGSDSISTSVDFSKKWQDLALHYNAPCGAQYDFVVRNTTTHNFYNWIADYTFPYEISEDSTWNGDYVYEGNHLLFTPNEDISKIMAGTDRGFGGVFYATDYQPPIACTISGYYEIHAQDMPLYHIVIALMFAWGICLAVSIFVKYKTRQYEKLVEREAAIVEQTMKTITGFIDAKDPYTRGHSIRVACYSQEIAKRLKMKDDEIRNLYYITLMHDCGKVGIPDSILKKPGKLTPEEFEIIKQHTTIGNQILENFTAIDGIREGAHYHHERYDGNGYPEGLKGEKIPLFARIICVADSYDAMSSTRCYRPALSEEIIREELTKNSGKQFAPEIVDVMLDMLADGFVQTVKNEYPTAE